MRLNISKITIVTAALVLGPIFAFAWTSAPGTPPSNNVDAPINAGGTAQAKVAGLLLNTGNNTNGLIVQYGKVGIDTVGPSYALQVGNSGDGSAIGSNAFFYISDVTLKKNIATLPDALSKILQLRGVSFNWKSTGAKAVGVVAQEVEKVYPELVNTDSKGIKSVQEGNLVAPLIEAVKAQQKQIEALKARVAALEAKAK